LQRHPRWGAAAGGARARQVFNTPLIKVRRAKVTRAFFTQAEYNAWTLGTEANGGKGWAVKYYKGLGTNTRDEMKSYFQNLPRHLVTVEFTADAPALFEMAFDRNHAAARRTWLETFGGYANGTGAMPDPPRPGETLPMNRFINSELVVYSNSDNMRSLPSFFDGLKRSQMKVLFVILEKNIIEDIKVAQLQGIVSERAQYHHGEASLNGTMTRMAQDFPGANNLPLLVPSGQFGTRLDGGSDHASPRYIFTRMQPYLRRLFHPDDDSVLTHTVVDGVRAEPEYFLPIIPMLLVQGCDGIGTGYSCHIPPHHTRDVVAAVRSWIAASVGSHVPESHIDLKPGFSKLGGRVERDATTGEFVHFGVFEWVSEHSVRITELPAGVWTRPYLALLEKMRVSLTASGSGFVVESTGDDVTVRIEVNDARLRRGVTSDDEVVKMLSLSTRHHGPNVRLLTNNMYCLDGGKPRRLSSAAEYVAEWCRRRREFYQTRKENLIAALEARLVVAQGRARFITEKLNGTLVIRGKTMAEMVTALESAGYVKRDAVASEGGGFNYILNDLRQVRRAPTSSLDQQICPGFVRPRQVHETVEKVESLRAEEASMRAKMDAVRTSTPEDMWMRDLDALEGAIPADFW